MCTHYGPLQCFSIYFRKLKEMGVLQHLLPDHVISCDYGLMEDLMFNDEMLKVVGFRYDTKTFCQNSDKFGDSFIKMTLYLCIYFVFTKIPLF